MSGRLAGRVALVTGAAGPTGSTIARRLAAEGAAVALNIHRAPERLDPVVTAIREAGGRAVICLGDVSVTAEAVAIVGEATARLGPIDILVNNASSMPPASPFSEMPDSTVEHALRLDLGTAIVASRAVVGSMIARGYGRIVSISSIAATGSFENAAYAVAKAGVEGLTRTLALELGRHGITVNCVSPGLIASHKTQRAPGWRQRAMVWPSAMRRPVEPIDIANAVLFFASDEARYITGQILHVSAGLDVVVRGMQEPEFFEEAAE